MVSVAFMPGKKTLISGSYDTTIKIWHVRTTDKINELIGHTDVVN